MRWSRGVHAVVTAAGFLALVAVSVTFLVNAGSQPSSVTRAVPSSPVVTPVPSTSLSRLPTSSPATGPPRSPRTSSGSAPAPAPTLLLRRPRLTSLAPRPERLDLPAAPRVRVEEDLPSLELTLSSFNVLGASHTRPGGSRPGYAAGTVRAGWAADLLARHGSDVIGFQELQVSQLRTLRASTDLDFHPGLTMGRFGAENSIGWRRGEWTAVDRRTIDIPYFDGNPRVMPVVRLRHVGTGVEAWFANFHNPADTSRFPRQQRFRTRATIIEARLASLLTATGLPVFVTGDMNERAEYFCQLTSRAPMVAARGGSNVGGRCRAEGPAQVDWIFGSQGVQFTDYVEDDGAVVDRTSDHPLITARVRIQSAATPAENDG